MTLVATPEEWNNVLDSKGLTVVDVYNSWCGPCTAIHPTFQRLQTHLNQNNLKLNFFLADTEKSEDLKKYNVGAEPLFVIYMDGKVKETVGGGVNLPRILRTLSKYISPDAIFSFSPAQEAPPPPPFTPRGGDAKPLLVTPRTMAAQQAAAQTPSFSIMVPDMDVPSIDLVVPDFPSDTASNAESVGDDTSSVDEKRDDKKGMKSPRSQKKPSGAPKLSLSPSTTDHNQSVSPRTKGASLGLAKPASTQKLKKAPSGTSL